MNVRAAEILLAAVISARATSFMFSKLLLVSMGPFTLLGIRFLIAFALLALIFHKKLARMNKRTFLFGFVLGLAFFATMAFELKALVSTDTSRVSFLENTAIVLVPLGEALIAKKLPSKRAFASALIALAGVGLLTLNGTGSSISSGEFLAIGAALAYTAALMFTARFSKQEDALVMGILQVGWIGAFGLAAAFLVETPVLPAGPLEWTYLAVLIVVCTGFGFTLQPVAQRGLTAGKASLMCAISPVVAAILGAVFLGETISTPGLCGLALILSSIVLSSLGNPSAPAAATAQEPSDASSFTATQVASDKALVRSAS